MKFGDEPDWETGEEMKKRIRKRTLKVIIERMREQEESREEMF